MRWGLVFLLFLPLLLSLGCASKITRYGYTVQDMPDRDKYLGCSMPIKKNFSYSKEDVEVLGELLSGDSGVSLNCGKGYVLGLLRQEACALKADLINIIYERNMDLWSSCYRAKAQFLHFKDRELATNLKSDTEYLNY